MAVSSISSAAIDYIGGIRDIKELSKSALIGAASSLFGFGAGKAAGKISGKIAINNLANKSSSQIKKTITSAIKVTGRDRNMVKKVAWTMSQNTYKNTLSKALASKKVILVTNSISTGIFGYGVSKIALSK